MINEKQFPTRYETYLSLSPSHSFPLSLTHSFYLLRRLLLCADRRKFILSVPLTFSMSTWNANRKLSSAKFVHSSSSYSRFNEKLLFFFSAFSVRWYSHFHPKTYTNSTEIHPVFLSTLSCVATLFVFVCLDHQHCHTWTVYLASKAILYRRRGFTFSSGCRKCSKCLAEFSTSWPITKTNTIKSSPGVCEA